MTKTLTICKLNARKLNGFVEKDNILIEGLQTGLNIVYAPNRAGKTTLTLAYRMAIGDTSLGKFRDGDIVEAVGILDKEEAQSVVANGLRTGTIPVSPIA